MCAEMNYMAIPGIPRFSNRDRSKLFRVFDSEILIKTICEHFKTPLETLQVKRRTRELAFPRQVIMFFLAEYTDMTYREIGAVFSRDHTTAIHSKDTVIDLMTTDDKVRDRIDELKKQIANNH